MPFVSSRSHYLSISDILACQERVPCIFNEDVTHIGCIDPSSESEVIREGTKLELPLWLAQSLQAAGVSAVQVPTVYSNIYRDILRADANVVNLYSLCKYFYEFGLMVALTQRRGIRELCDVLLQTLLERLTGVCVKALISEDNTVGERLDCMERSLVASARHSSSLLTSWLSSASSTIKMAQLVNFHKKRKLLESSLPT